jgi:branched-chain amino acid transport system substrate-binding protein
MSFRSHRLWARGLSVVGILLTLAACGGGATPQSSGGQLNVVIGFPTDLTGTVASFGLAQQRAVGLAVDDVNKSGRVKITAVQTKDTQSNAAATVAAVQGMISDKVTAIVGFVLTGNLIASMPLLKESGIPTIGLQSTQLPNRGTNVFSMSPSPTGSLHLLVEKVFVPSGVKSVGFIWQEQATLTASTTLLRTLAKDNGIAVVADQGASLATTNFNSQITAVLAAKPDAVVLETQVQHQGSIDGQLRQLGYKGLIAGEQTAGTQAFRDIAGQAATDYLFTTLWDPSVANASAKRYISLYKAKYPDAPAPYVYDIVAWDAVHMIAQAVDKTNSTDAAKISAELASATFPGAITDQIKFGSDGFAALNGYVVQYATPTTTRKRA